MNILGVIPARFESQRFPGKALADIAGKSMVQRVFEGASKAQSLKKLLVATDSKEINDHVIDFGGASLMTSTDHKNGTERCGEALDLVDSGFDYVINIQGDEPMINPKQIDLVASILDDAPQIATLVKKINTLEELQSTNVNKVILNLNQEAIYFSRTPLPYFQRLNMDEWIHKHIYYKHIGIYGYHCDILREIIKLPPTPLEKAEALEQLRWLEHGYTIKTAETEIESFGVDTPEDLKRLLTTYFHQD